MPLNEQLKRQIRLTAFLAVGLFGCLVFGIVLLTTGDWIPGTVIVVASGIGLGRQAPLIHKLCTGSTTPPPPKSRPAG